MTILELHILCKKEKIEEAEETKIAKQLEDLGISVNTEKEVLHEWRKGYISVNSIEAFYSHGGNTENTMIHCVSGAVITVKEPIDYIVSAIASTSQNVNQNTSNNGKYNYNYSIAKI